MGCDDKACEYCYGEPEFREHVENLEARLKTTEERLAVAVDALEAMLVLISPDSWAHIKAREALAEIKKNYGSKSKRWE